MCPVLKKERMSSSSSPCAACKLRRQKCAQECIFAPYFPPDQPKKFANVHEVFGASNVAKILNELNPAHREDAVNSLAYEAEARLQNPVYGCVGLISILQHKLKQVHYELYHSKNELAKYVGPSAMLPVFDPGLIQQHPSNMSVLPYNMQPMLGLQQGNQMMMIQENQQQQQQQQQMVDQAQQLAVAVAEREQQEMIRTYEQQQQQQQQQPEVVTFGNGYDNRQVTASGFNHTPSSEDMSPLLALGTYDNNIDYQIQTQQQQPQPQQLLLQQSLQRAGSEDEARSFGPSL